MSEQEDFHEPGVGRAAAEWEWKAAQRALDDLFLNAGRYRQGEEHENLFKFVTQFRFYSPFNAMLIHIQQPGATFVATASRWVRHYRRAIKAGARPLVILQPRGPVMFVFDVSDTLATENSRPIPEAVEKPFEAQGGREIGNELEKTEVNARRDGVDIYRAKVGSQQAGSIRLVRADDKGMLKFKCPTRENPAAFVLVPREYELETSESLSPEATYATIVHELGHLYCGHLGMPYLDWKEWPDRRWLDLEMREVEAESVAYLVCQRLGVATTSDKYLAGWWKDDKELPSSYSLEQVMRVSGLIESMSRRRLPPRPKPEALRRA